MASWKGPALLDKSKIHAYIESYKSDDIKLPKKLRRYELKRCTKQDFEKDEYEKKIWNLF